MAGSDLAVGQGIKTKILPVDASQIGQFVFDDSGQRFQGDWELKLSESSDAANMKAAASQLQNTDIPIAFPTETVYGLGADATRSSAVRGIYSAKQRPSDNPLIVHISSLSQLRSLLVSHEPSPSSLQPPRDSIPPIYHPLISRFWPGPLTILLPLPTPSPFAPEVTNNLHTVGVRMPSALLALALIHLAGVPLAAPSANASTRPSPTTAAHVLHDLSGRIDIILDGGPCDVGVESTIVDGLTHPPVILRPGGVSLEMLRQCPGWEDVKVGYKDGAEGGTPKVPGMKYKHYSPTARVLLVHGQFDFEQARQYLNRQGSIGVLRRKTWRDDVRTNGEQRDEGFFDPRTEQQLVTTEAPQPPMRSASLTRHSQARLMDGQDLIDVWDIALGPDITDISRGLFSALREFDHMGVDVIFVESVDDEEGDTAAAIMNRLRKAAEMEIKM